MSKKRFMLLTLAFISYLFPSPCPAADFGARAAYWFPSMDSEITVDADGIPGTKIDFEDDLGIDNEDFPGFEIFLKGKKHQLSLSYMDIDFSGRNIISRNIVFNGQTYLVNALVDASLEFRMIDLQYQYQFINLEKLLAGISLAGILQVKYLDGDVSLKTIGVDETEDFKLPIPLAGLNLGVGIVPGWLEAEIKGTGMAYSGNNAYELKGELTFTPFNHLDIRGGYRVIALDVDEQDVVLDYSMSGPYVMASIWF